MHGSTIGGKAEGWQGQGHRGAGGIGADCSRKCYPEEVMFFFCFSPLQSYHHSSHLRRPLPCAFVNINGKTH